MKKFLNSLSPAKSTARKDSDLLRSASISKSDSYLHPQASTTPATRRPNSMASNNPFADMVDTPPPYSPDSTMPSTYQTPNTTGYQAQSYQQYPTGGLSQSYYQQTSSYGSMPARPASTVSSSSTGSKVKADHDDDDKYAFLSKFDTVFLIDDSGSMAGSRWKETMRAVEAIAPICTKYDKDGIDIHFLNHKTAYENVTSAAKVSSIFNSVSPQGMTFSGEKLDDLTRPYLKRLQKNIDNTKPMNIIFITDGEPSDEPDLVLISIAKKLDKMDARPWQLGVQFLQVGNDPRATQHLQDLDDKLSKKAGDDEMRDIVDTQPFRSDRGSVINADGILKTVLGAVLKRQDNLQGRHLHH
jgi:uncharacterized protein YegL